jgi:hypothetical protein
MKKLLLLLLCAFMLGAQGCSDETQEDLEELGNDIERDIEDAAD